MRILKSHPLLKLANSYVIDSPQPSNLSYLWNFGSLLAFCLIIQIATGVTLAMHYNPSVQEAFNSIEHIMRDVNNGWLIRYLHSNTASAFFFLVYLHIGRGLYYGSYKSPRTLVWIIGTIIFILMMATAFLGFLHSPKWFEFDFIFINCINNILITTRNNSNTLENFLKEHKLNPVFRYDNLHLDNTRKTILNDTKNLSGIYMIYNNITGQYYIGSASTNRIYARFYNHLVKFIGSKVIKNAVRKYKLGNFTFLVLELFPDVITRENNKDLIDLEDFYLKSLLPDYNILTEAGSSFGYKHTEITRIKMKSSYSQDRRDCIGNLNKGKSLSKETIEKIRQKALNKKDIIYSDEALINMRKMSKPIILYNLDKTVFGKFISIIEAARNIHCNEKTIKRALQTNSKILKRRFIVEYLEK
jgi:group I intron endonuclease